MRRKIEYCRNNGYFVPNYKSKMLGITEITVTSRNNILAIETFDDRLFYDGEYRKYKTRTLSDVENDYLNSIKMLEQKTDGKK